MPVGPASDPFLEPVTRFFHQVDEFIEQLNQWLQQWTVVRGLGAAPQRIEPVGRWLFEMLVGINPQADERSLLALAEYWFGQAQGTQERLRELVEATQGVNASWVSDGGAVVLQEELQEVVLSTTGLAETQRSVGFTTSMFAMTTIQARAAFRAQVVLLAGELVFALATAVPSLGSSVVTFSLHSLTRVVTIRMIVRTILDRIKSLVIDSSLRPLTRRPGPIAGSLPRPRSLSNPARPDVRVSRVLDGPPDPPVHRGRPGVLRRAGQRVAGSPAGVVGRRLFSRPAAARQAGDLHRGIIRREADQLRRLADQVGAAGGRRVAPSRLVDALDAQRGRLRQAASPRMRAVLTRELAAGLRGQAAAAPTRLGWKVTDPALQAAARQAAQDAVRRGGATVGRGIWQGIKGYGGTSAVMFGAGGWALQELFTGWDLHQHGDALRGVLTDRERELLGLVDHSQWAPLASLAHLGRQTVDPSGFAGLISSIVGAGAGGGVLALGSRTPTMFALGGAGGVGGWWAANLTQGLLDPTISLEQAFGGGDDDRPRPWRAGGAPDLWTAMWQGALGGAWERHVGEFASRHAALPNWRTLATVTGLAAPTRQLALPLHTTPPPPAATGQHWWGPRSVSPEPAITDTIQRQAQQWTGEPDADPDTAKIQHLFAEIVDQALAHPADPAYWKPTPEGGWLLSDPNRQPPLAVGFNATGRFTGPQWGGFTPTTTSVASDAVAALRHVLETGADTPDGHRVLDAETGLVDMVMPDGSRRPIQWKIDTTLAEGQAHATSGGSEPTVVVLSGTVRTDPAQAAADTAARLNQILHQLTTQSGPVLVQVDASAGNDQLQQQPDLVREVAQGLLPQLPATGTVPGLESAVSTDDRERFELVYNGQTVQARITPTSELPPGTARVDGLSIEVSDRTAPGRAGQLTTAAVISKALRALGSVLTDPAGPLASDPYAELRTSRHEPAAQEILDGVTALSPTGASGSAELAESTDRLATVLAAAETSLDERHRAREQAARAAERRAAGHRTAAAEAGAMLDRFAPERARSKLAAGERELVTAARHRQLSAAYRRARDLARAAMYAYRDVAAELTELAAVGSARPAERLGELVRSAQRAREAYREYQDAVARTHPVQLDAAAPVGAFADLPALTDRLNAGLARYQIRDRVTPAELASVLGNWRWVAGSDGAVMTVGPAEVRIRYRLRDPVEVLGSLQNISEMMLAQHPQYPHSSLVVGAALNRRRGVDLSIPLDAVGMLVPGAWPVMRHVVLRLRGLFARHWSAQGDGFDFSLPGAVADNRGEAVPYHVAGEVEIWLRKPDETSQWTLIDRMSARGVELAVPHPFTEPPPARTERLERPVDTKLPEHAATGLTNLEELNDTVVGMLARDGRVGSIARQQVRNLVLETLPNRLEEMANAPTGWLSAISDGGKVIGAVQIRVEVLSEEVTPVGAPSDAYHLEVLRVTNTGTTAETAMTRVRGLGQTVGARTDPVNAAGGKLLGSHRAGSERHTRLIATRTGSRTSVQRQTGHTQSNRFKFIYHVAVKRYDSASPPQRASVTGSGTLLMAETEAFRAGFPVAATALRRNRDGMPVYGPEGIPLLRGDLMPGAPPGREPRLPDWLGPDGIAGAGPALVQRLTGVDAVRRQLEARLRQRGWLPELDEHNLPILSRNDMVRTSQMANLLAVQDLVGSRLEGWYDQAALGGGEPDGGVPLQLVREGVNQATERLTLRIRLGQDWQRVTLLGHTDTKTIVNVDLTSHRLLHQAGTERIRRLEVRAEASAGLGDGKLRGRAHGARESTTAAATESGQMTVEGAQSDSSGLVAVFEVPHRLEVVEVINGDRNDPVLARSDGSAELVLPADLLPERGPAPDPSAEATRPGPMPTSRRALRRARFLHFQATGVWEAVRAALPRGSQPGSPAYLHLAAHTNVRSLLGHPAWLFSEHRTDSAVDPRGTAPLRSTLKLRGRPGATEFVAVTNMVISGISQREEIQAVRHRWQSAGEGGADARGELAGGAMATGERIGRRQDERTTTVARRRERMAPETGKQYVYRMLTDIEVEGIEHHPTGSRSSGPIQVRDRMMLYALPEWYALKLWAEGDVPVPLTDVADALTRYSTGRLRLDPQIATAVLARFHAAPAHPAPTITSPPGNALEPGVSMPEHLVDALGQAGIEPPDTLTNRAGERVEDRVFEEVLRLFEAVAPGAVDRTPGLHPGLAGQLAGRAWESALDTMLTPDGWAERHPVRVGRDRVEYVTVRLAARLLGAREVERVYEAGAVLQDHTSVQEETAEARGWDYRSGGVADARGSHGPDLGVETGRGSLSTASVSSERTRIQRLSTFGGGADAGTPRLSTVDRGETGLDRVERQIEIRIDVVRPGAVGDHHTAAEVLRGTVVQRVPPGLLIRGAPAGSAGPPAEERSGPVRLPYDVAVESTRVDGLYERVHELLAVPSWFGAAAMAAQEVPLRRQVAAAARTAAQAAMSAPHGRAAAALIVPGTGRTRMAEITITARPRNLRVIARGRDQIELGYDERRQHVSVTTQRRTRLLPVTWLPGYGGGWLDGLLGRLFFGMAATETFTVLTGDRDETKLFRRGIGATGAVGLDFDVTVREVVVRRGGEQLVTRTADLPGLATGTAYVTVFETDLDGPAAPGHVAVRSARGSPSGRGG